jgi:hypothetical protein
MQRLKFYHFSGITALIIAACSATFSVYGFSKLFAGSRLAIIVMLSILEIAKIISVSMIYNYKKKLPKMLQKYLFGAIFVLMFFTSLGTYGFMANAYQKSSDLVSTSTTKEVYNVEQQDLSAERVKNYREQLTSYKSRKETLNQQRSSQEQRLTRAQEALNRRMIDQARNDIKQSDTEIKDINSRIDSAYNGIAKENDNLNTLKKDSYNIREQGRKIDVGPLRYLSKLFSNSMDSIVTILILILVFVFDPLAVVLWLSTNAIVKAEKDQKPKTIITEKLPKEKEDLKILIRKVYDIWKRQNQDNTK